MKYTMKQMAAMFDVTEHTLRYYTDLGLLPCERDSGNRRMFNEESVNWMQGIQCLKGALKISRNTVVYACWKNRRKTYKPDMQSF